MNDAHIDGLLDELVAPFEARGDGWADVLSRAHRARRRIVLVAAALLALLLVPTALALSGRIGDLFEGTPAPPSVSKILGAMADAGTKNGFHARLPQADVANAHGVIEIQTTDGPQDLWAAFDDQGGRCLFVDFADDPVGPSGKYGYGMCDDAHPEVDMSGGGYWVARHPSLFTLLGNVFVPADRVVVRLQDGSSSTSPVVEGAYLASVPREAGVERVVAYDGDRQVASWGP